MESWNLTFLAEGEQEQVLAKRPVSSVWMEESAGKKTVWREGNDGEKTVN